MAVRQIIIAMIVSGFITFFAYLLYKRKIFREIYQPTKYDFDESNINFADQDYGLVYKKYQHKYPIMVFVLIWIAISMVLNVQWASRSSTFIIDEVYFTCIEGLLTSIVVSIPVIIAFSSKLSSSKALVLCLSKTKAKLLVFLGIGFNGLLYIVLPNYIPSEPLAITCLVVPMVFGLAAVSFLLGFARLIISGEKAECKKLSEQAKFPLRTLSVIAGILFAIVLESRIVPFSIVFLCIVSIYLLTMPVLTFMTIYVKMAMVDQFSLTNGARIFLLFYLILRFATLIEDSIVNYYAQLPYMILFCIPLSLLCIIGIAAKDILTKPMRNSVTLVFCLFLIPVDFVSISLLKFRDYYDLVHRSYYPFAAPIEKVFLELSRLNIFPKFLIFTNVLIMSFIFIRIILPKTLLSRFKMSERRKQISVDTNTKSKIKSEKWMIKLLNYAKKNSDIQKKLQVIQTTIRLHYPNNINLSQQMQLIRKRTEGFRKEIEKMVQYSQDISSKLIENGKDLNVCSDWLMINIDSIIKFLHGKKKFTLLHNRLTFINILIIIVLIVLGFLTFDVISAFLHNSFIGPRPLIKVGKIDVTPFTPGKMAFFTLLSLFLFAYFFSLKIFLKLSSILSVLIISLSILVVHLMLSKIIGILNVNTSLANNRLFFFIWFVIGEIFGYITFLIIIKYGILEHLVFIISSVFGIQLAGLFMDVYLLRLLLGLKPVQNYGTIFYYLNLGFLIFIIFRKLPTMHRGYFYSRCFLNMIWGASMYSILTILSAYIIGEKLEEVVWFLNIEKPFIFTIYFSFILSFILSTKKFFLKMKT